MDLTIGDTQRIIAEGRAQGLLRNQLAYVLATAFWETARSMEPIKETVMPHHQDKHPSDAEVIRRLDRAFAKGVLSWVKRPYWRTGFFGRGFVQLTHEANYKSAGEKLGVDLVGNPGDAMRPEISAKIIVRGMKEGWFTGKKLADYITLSKSDFRNARRIVNGMDKAREIAELANRYDDALRAAGYGTAPPPPPEPSYPTKPSLWASLRALWARITGA